MDETPRSSFIPKQGAGMIPTTVRKRKRFYVFGFIGTVFLVSALLLAVGTYFYKGSTLSKLEAEKRALAAEKDKFSEAQILEVRQFERKLKATTYLLDNHIAPSKIFEALQSATIIPVQFLSFSLDQRPSQDVTLTLVGGTETFRKVALQALSLGGDALFREAFLTELATIDASTVPEEDGGESDAGSEGEIEHRIGFSIASNIDSSLLMYDGDPMSVIRSQPVPPSDQKSTQ